LLGTDRATVAVRAEVDFSAFESLAEALVTKSGTCRSR
jgi:hypothetical protein